MSFVIFITFVGGISLSWLFIVTSGPLCGPFLGAHSGGVNIDLSVLKEVFSDVLLTLECVCVARTEESTLLKNKSAVD